MLNSEPATGAANSETPQDAAVNEILQSGARGAIVLAGIATAIVIALWFAFYFLVFMPRGVRHDAARPTRSSAVER
jgi:hypothetical protein